MNNKYRYFLIYKPFNMLSQFTREGNHATLADLGQFPSDVYPVGRLDSDSEGTLLLTNDTRINKLMLDPENGHQRTYWVQVEGIITSEAIEKLCNGVLLNINGKSFTSKKAWAKAFISPPDVPERKPPIRHRVSVPDSWIELRLSEGKNRQVRRMTAAVGFPTLRLIRKDIEGLSPEPFMPGTINELSAEKVFKALGIKETPQQKNSRHFDKRK